MTLFRLQRAKTSSNIYSTNQWLSTRSMLASRQHLAFLASFSRPSKSTSTFIWCFTVASCLMTIAATNGCDSVNHPFKLEYLRKTPYHKEGELYRKSKFYTHVLNRINRPSPYCRCIRRTHYSCHVDNRVTVCIAHNDHRRNRDCNGIRPAVCSSPARDRSPFDILARRIGRPAILFLKINARSLVNIKRFLRHYFSPVVMLTR